MLTLITTSERALTGIFFILIAFCIESTLKGKALKLEQKLDCRPPDKFYWENMMKSWVHRWLILHIRFIRFPHYVFSVNRHFVKLMFPLFPYLSYGELISELDFYLYYIHFEITGDPCNLIGSQQCDLFPNRTIFCSKSHLFQIASFMF